MSLSMVTPRIPEWPEARNGVSASASVGIPALSPLIGGRWAGDDMHQTIAARLRRQRKIAIVVALPGRSIAGVAISISRERPTAGAIQFHSRAPQRRRAACPTKRAAMQTANALKRVATMWISPKAAVDS